MLMVTADNLPRLLFCNGSRLMAGFTPAIDVDNTSREEGTAAHWLANMVATGKEPDIINMLNKRAVNGVIITAEMIDNVDGYLEMIRERGLPPHIEQETSFGNEHYQVRGRCDNSQFNNITLYIDDFKYGFSIVEPEANWTLISHAIGIVQQLGMAPVKIVFTIFQPRPYHVRGRMRQCTMEYAELVEAYNFLNSRMSALNNELHTSPHCRKCPAITNCPAARKANLNAVDLADMAHNEDLPDEELGYELDILDRAATMIKARREALDNLAKHRLKEGKRIENYWLENAQGNRKFLPWLDGAAITALTGVEASKSATVTPAQLIKLGADEALVNTISERPITGLKLVREDEAKRAMRLLGQPPKG